MMAKLYSVPNHMLCLNSLNLKALNKTIQPKLLVSWLPLKQPLFVMINLKMASLRTIQTIKVLNSKSKATLKGQEDRSILTMLCYIRPVVSKSLPHLHKTTKIIPIVILRTPTPNHKRERKMVPMDPKSCLEKDNVSHLLRTVHSNSHFQKMGQSRVWCQ